VPQYRLLVATNPLPGRDDEYNDWYSNRHLDEVLRVVDGCLAAQRFRVVDPEAGAHRYYALYEFEADSAQAVRDALDRGTPSMEVSPSVDMAGVSMALLEDLTPRVTR
jgi:hypothetical protein